MTIISAVFSLIEPTIRMSLPIILASMGGLISEKSGVVNIALEGKMLIGAFFAAVVTYYSQNQLYGLLAGGIFGLIFSCIYAFFTINLRSNQIVTGLAFNLFVAGILPFISVILFQNTSSTPSVKSDSQFFYFIFFLSLFFLFITWGLFKYSRLGLWIETAGQNPEALESEGISLVKTRWLCVLLTGFLAGLGGAALSTCLSSNYTRNMTAGRGFMAVAAMIIGGWNPIFTFISSFIFGLFDAIGIKLQNTDFNQTSQSQLLQFFTSVQFIQIIPYVLTLVVVCFFIRKNNPPKYLGISHK